MIRQEKEGIEWLEFELLADIPLLKHGVFLRHGGAGTGPYASLNFSYQVDDNPDHVAFNVAQGKKVLGINTVVRGRLAHGSGIAAVTDETPPANTCDALITDRPGLGLMITHADCQAAILYDPINKAIANIHCGWRGTIQNIYSKTVAVLKKRYGSKPENLMACISPSLGPNHAEFVNYKTEWPDAFWKYQVKPAYFDLWSLSEDQLLQCGLLPGHIEIARLCTYASPQDFFSYRRDKTCGRHATIVGLAQ